MRWTGWGGYGWWWGMGILHLLFWIVVIVAVVALVRPLSARPGARSSGTDRAMEILGERYARGEIGADEFEEKRRDLERGP